MRIDLHNHTLRCNHASGTQEDYIKKAIELGIDIYGFSDHAPMDYDKKYRMGLDEVDEYEKDTINLSKKYKKDITILLGYEVDFINDKQFIENRVLKADVDYLIGSVHFINFWGFDNPEFIGEYKNKDIDKIWEDYFESIYLMAKSGYFQIVGHLDLLKVFKYLPKKDIRLIAKKALKEIKKQNLVVEINSAGFDKPIDEQYPSISLLEQIYELDIDICFGSDAHKIEQVGRYYDKVLSIAKDIGFNKQAYFIKKDKIIDKI